MPVYQHKNGKEIEEFFKCHCHSPEHIVIFNYWKETNEEDKELYISIYLDNYRNFFQRLWAAILYIGGHQTRCGAFDEITFRKDDINRLFNLIKLVKEDMEGENN